MLKYKEIRWGGIMNNKEKGVLGEMIALKYLISQGIVIASKNFFYKNAEIDLIGIENETIIFIEVKLRFSRKYGRPYESVTKEKLNRIIYAALNYLIKFKLQGSKIRFDIISLEYDKIEKLFRVEWIKNIYF